MDKDEGAFVFILEGGTRSAVRLVADDQIEVSELVLLLRCADRCNGMIGAEDDSHVFVVVPGAYFLGEAHGIGGCGIAQLMRQGFDVVVVLIALLADVAV